MKRLFLAVILFATAGSSSAQEAAMTAGNAQRSRVLATQGPPSVPQTLVWKSKKLFVYRSSYATRATAGPISLWLDIPTFQDFTQPIVAKGVVYLTYNSSENGYFFALDAHTGEQLLTLQFDSNHVSAPAALGGTAYFGAERGVHAYDVRTREHRWVFSQKDYSFSYAALTIHDGTVYVAGKDLIALDAQTGSVRWSFQQKEGVSPVAVGQGSVVFTTAKQRLIALDVLNGAKQWEVKIGDVFPPAILKDQIFLRSKSGEVRVYNLRDGSLIWEAKRRGGAGTALALYNDTVIYGSRDDSIFALDSKTGEDKWQFQTKRPCDNPIVAGATVYVRCVDRKLYALDALTGEEVWRYDNKKSTPPPPTFADGIMYMLGTDGILTAIR